MVAKGKYGNVSLDNSLLFRVDVAVKGGFARSRASLVRSAILEYLDKYVAKREQSQFPVDVFHFDATKEARTP